MKNEGLRFQGLMKLDILNPLFTGKTMHDTINSFDKSDEESDLWEWLC